MIGRRAWSKISRWALSAHNHKRLRFLSLLRGREARIWDPWKGKQVRDPCEGEKVHEMEDPMVLATLSHGSVIVSMYPTAGAMLPSNL